MPREVFDPKNPEPEFYNANKPKSNITFSTSKKPRRKNILRSRAFIIGYGIFLIIVVSAITIYQKKGIGNTELSKAITKLVRRNIISIKINNLETYTDKIKTTIEIENKKYKAELDSIKELKTYTTLLSNDVVLSSNYNTYNNVMFRNRERVGYSLNFRKYLWDSSDTIDIKIIINDKDEFEKKINTRMIRLKK